jgi:hypothetical protein
MRYIHCQNVAARPIDERKRCIQLVPEEIRLQTNFILMAFLRCSRSTAAVGRAVDLPRLREK